MKMHTVQLKPGIYWVGAIDWNIRNFHGYTTDLGSTYNAYLIIDEKITLIDTVKHHLADELMGRIAEIVDPAKIDYVISNHVEMDHSGAIPTVMNYATNAKLVTVAGSGLKGLTTHYGEYDYMPVKAGDVLSIGKRNLTFVATPMLHWPDNMVTYCPEEKILFSNDAFGQHFASNLHFEDEVSFDEVIRQAKKYYANILMLYGAQARKALEIINTLDLDMIAPSHGIIWRTKEGIQTILDYYEIWSSEETNGSAVIVYDSMYHSTEKMALTILEAFTSMGISAKYYDLKQTHMSDIATDILNAKYLAVGSSTLNNNMLATVSGFLCYIKGLAPKGLTGLAFGSYGWSGQSIGQVADILKDMNCEMPFDNYKLMYIPKKEDLDAMFADIVSKL